MSEINFKCPQCHQSIEAPSDMSGERVECPSCSAAIKVPFPQTNGGKRIVVKKRAPVKRRPSEFNHSLDQARRNATAASTRRAPPPKKDSGPVGAGWVCFLLGIVLAFVPYGILLCGPLFLVSLILAIVILAKGNVGAGLVLLLLSILVLTGIGILVAVGVLAFAGSLLLLLAL
jgi:DNA-directed RNA polymerase subunit RPC12/RpoP